MLIANEELAAEAGTGTAIFDRFSSINSGRGDGKDTGATVDFVSFCSMTEEAEKTSGGGRRQRRWREQKGFKLNSKVCFLFIMTKSGEKTIIIN